MADVLTLEQLAASTGEPPERLRDWRTLGLIGSDRESFLPEDIERVRLVQLLLRHGLTADTVARAEKDLSMLSGYVDLIFPQGIGPTYSLAEAAELLGLDLDWMKRMWSGFGFTDQGETLRQEDLEAFGVVKTLRDIGLTDDALLEGSRVYSDSLARVAEMESRLFHFYVHERLRAQGLSGRQLIEAVDTAGEQALPLMEPTLLYWHRKGFERALREDAVMHMAEAAGLLPLPDVPGEMIRAVSFIDLASFTPLAAAMGDVAAAQVLERFSQLVRQSVNAGDGRVVKQIGDAFMAVFPDARHAVAAILEIESRAAKEPQFPAARAGIHWGSVLYREGDYVGSNVNIASRIANEAQRHQVLVTAEVRKEARDLPEIEFVRLGKRNLKGVSVKLDLFEVRSSAVPAAAKAVDPVCGMDLGPGEIAAHLALEGAERAFCSEACLRKFVVSPEAYDG